MRRCVSSRNLKNEEAMANVRPQRHRGNKIIEIVVRDFVSNKRYGSQQKLSVKLQLYPRLVPSHLKGYHAADHIELPSDPNYTTCHFCADI
jgi:hypothetical protein